MGRIRFRRVRFQPRNRGRNRSPPTNRGHCTCHAANWAQIFRDGPNTFWRVRFQTPNSVSFFALTEFRRESSVTQWLSLSPLLAGQSELTKFFAELTEFAPKLSEAQWVPCTQKKLRASQTGPLTVTYRADGEREVNKIGPVRKRLNCSLSNVQLISLGSDWTHCDCIDMRYQVKADPSLLWHPLCLCSSVFVPFIPILHSGKFQGVVEACARLHANFGEARRSLANLANQQRHAHENLDDIHQSSDEDPSHSPEFRWRCLLYLGGLQNLPNSKEPESHMWAICLEIRASPYKQIYKGDHGH